MELYDFKKKQLINFLDRYDPETVEIFTKNIYKAAKYGIGINPEIISDLTENDHEFISGISAIIRVDISPKYKKDHITFLGSRG